MNRLISLGFLAVCLNTSQYARAQQNSIVTNYYFGVATIRVLLPTQTPPSSEQVLLKRIIDPVNGYIVELACILRIW